MAAPNWNQDGKTVPFRPWVILPKQHLGARDLTVITIWQEDFVIGLRQKHLYGWG